jgi:ABC-type branched-subunit amino acid transport system ATPase component
MAASVESLNFPLLKVENLSKRFGSSAAVTIISFSVPENEIVGVIGANRSGETILSITHFPQRQQIPTVLFRLSPGTDQSSPRRTIRKCCTIFQVLFLVRSEFGPKQIALSITMIRVVKNAP